MHKQENETLPGGWLAEWSENDKRVTYLHVPSRALCPHHPVPSPVDLLSHRVCMPTTLHTPRKIDTIPFGSGKGGAFRHRASLRLRGRRQVPASQQQQQQQRDRHLEYVERCVAVPLLSRGDRWRSRRDTARRYRYIRRTVFCRAMQTHQPLLTNLVATAGGTDKWMRKASKSSSRRTSSRRDARELAKSASQLHRSDLLQHSREVDLTPGRHTLFACECARTARAHSYLRSHGNRSFVFWAF